MGHNLPHWQSYFHSIVHLKKILLYMKPEFREIVGLVEQTEMLALSIMFSHFENLTDSKLQLLVLLHLFDDVQRLGKICELDAAIANELQIAMKSRLQALCTKFFDFGYPKKPRKNLKNLRLASVLNSNEETSSCLPPHYHGSSHFLWVELKTMEHVKRDTLNSTPCLLSRSNNIDGYRDITQTGHCSCGWISDSIPTEILQWFGFSTKTFLRYFHTEYDIRFGVVQIVPDDYDLLLKSIFDTWQLDGVGLLYKMSVFYQSFQDSLTWAFGITHQENDRTSTKLSDDQLLTTATLYREAIFFHVFLTAGELMSAFFASGQRCADTQELTTTIWKYNQWFYTRPPELEKALRHEDHVMIVLDFLRANIATGVSQEDYFSRR